MWWVRFGALALVGAVAGGWLAIAADYQVSPTMRFGSFPLPLVFYQLEDGRWVDFVTPPFVLYPGLVANISSVIAAGGHSALGGVDDCPQEGGKGIGERWQRKGTEDGK